MTRDTETQQNEVFEALVKSQGRQESWMLDVLSYDMMYAVMRRWWRTQLKS